MLKVYGFGISFPSNMVRMAVNALELEHEFIMINLMQGEQQSESFLKVNPHGKVPAIEDDGFCLSESLAILRYLAQKAGKMYPSDLQQQALVDQYLQFASAHIGINISKVLFNQLLAPLLEIPRDEQSFADGHKFLGQYLPYVEKRLESNSFYTGDKITIADIALLAALDPCELIEVDLAPYSALGEWREKLRTRDWYLACHRYYGEGLIPES